MTRYETHSIITLIMRAGRSLAYAACRAHLPLLLAFFCVTTAGAATEPKVWTLETRAELLRGEARDVSITDNGTIRPAPDFKRIFDAEQPYIWSSVADRRGNIYLGAGHDGRIYRVAPDSAGVMRGSLLFDSEELDVFALAVAPDGTLYAGTSPDGRVYRINEAGKAEVFFDPPDKYIWALAVMPDGALAVGTGGEGKVYRVRAPAPPPAAALLADTNETHILSLTVSREGSLVAGTDPGGLVLRINGDGKLFALLDAPLREIRALSATADGTLYALAISDAATTGASRSLGGATTSSAASLTTTIGNAPGDISSSDVASVTSGSAAGGAGTPRGRSDLASARSAVFKVLPEGGADVIWSSPTLTGFALAPRGGEVLIGTNDRGRIYAVGEGGRTTLLVQAPEGQISSFALGDGNALFAATSNAGKLFQLQPTRAAQGGSYESPIEDAKFAADWGRLTWRGAGAIEMQTRSGNMETPDQTWSDWQPVAPDAAGARVLSPRARFIQWRALFGGAPSVSAFVEGVRLVYLPRNIRPEVLAVTALPPNVALQPLIPAGTDTTSDAANLNAALGTASPAVAPPPRRLFQRGALALQWQAEDRNGDALEYAIYYRALDEKDFRLLKDRVRDVFYTIDGQTLPDGRYLFRIVASDAPANPKGRALAGERTSEPIELDNTPPLVKAIDERPAATTRSTGDASSAREPRARFLVEDATGGVRRADVSINGGAWEPVFPEDGIADARAEIYVINVPVTAGATVAAETIVALRAFDRNGNVGTARVILR